MGNLVEELRFNLNFLFQNFINFASTTFMFKVNEKSLYLEMENGRVMFHDIFGAEQFEIEERNYRDFLT